MYSSLNSRSSFSAALQYAVACRRQVRLLARYDGIRSQQLIEFIVKVYGVYIQFFEEVVRYVFVCFEDSLKYVCRFDRLMLCDIAISADF